MTKPIYSQWSINYYRGALDGAFSELEEIEKALGVDRLRLRNRFEQIDLLVRALEELEDSSDDH